MRTVALTSLFFLAASAQPATNFVLVAHSGAGDYSKMTPRVIEARRDGMLKAIQAGYRIVAGGGTSLDAVEATIRSMEGSGLYDAGRGAYYIRDGIPEMDAAMMDGRTLQAGSVASVKHIANPIHLARLVMEKTPHVMPVADGAEEFAKSQGIELVSPYYFYTEREWKRFQDAAKEKKPGDGHGAVGVVALDMAGNLAAVAATGCTVLKMPGRVGDSPIIGAGTYANNDSCAVSATGTGEYFMCNVVASDLYARVGYLHVTLEDAANDVVMKELVAQHGDGGVIALDRQGNIATAFSTTGMMTGAVRGDSRIKISGTPAK
jgi:beta-aspartyl-peptidase (threonine type)